MSVWGFAGGGVLFYSTRGGFSNPPYIHFYLTNNNTHPTPRYNFFSINSPFKTYGAAGPNYAPVAACSTGAHAIGEALWSIRTGRTDAVIAGAAEAAVTPLGIGGFEAMRALSSRNGDPPGASRPFDRPWPGAPS